MTTDDVSMSPRLQRATLREISKLAGVDVSTVSRVLNGDAEERNRAAGKETIYRIRQIAVEVGYSPDPNAVNLRKQKTDLIGVLVPRLSDVVLSTIYEGIEEAAAAAGYYTVVANTHDIRVNQEARTQIMLNRRVEGLILGDAHFDAAQVIRLAGHGTPFVLVSRRCRDFPSVTCDDHLGGRLVAEHLIELGHERVAVVAGEPFASTGIDRTAGFLEVYRERGILVPEQMVRHSRFDTHGGHTAAMELLTSNPRPTAVFAVNDFAAIGVMGAIRELGLRIADDVSVVGFNDIPPARYLPIPLTTVKSPMHEMGRQALEMLLEVIRGESAEPRRLTPALIVRDSTQPV